MFPLRPRSGACCHLGRQMPTGRLLAIIHPAHDDADQNASNDQSRQIVPQQQTPLSERHTAALLQWQPFAAILELLRFEISPRNVARLYQTTCGGFLFPATHQSMPPGFKPPQHCASPGKPACRQFYWPDRPPALRHYAPCETHSRKVFCCCNKTKKAAGCYPCGPVRAHAATKAGRCPPVVYLRLSIQLTMMLTRMPAMIGAARSSHSSRPH